MPSPATKAAASARLNLSAIRCASHPSTSKALSSSSRCDAFGSAESSCSGIEIRSTCGVPVSAVAAVSVAQPAPMSVWSTSTSNALASTRHHVGDGADRGRRAQHADDLARGLRIDEIAAVRRHRGRQRLLLDGQAAQRRRRRRSAGRRRRPSCAAFRSRRPRASGGRVIAMDLRSSMAKRVSCSWSFALISDWKALNSPRNPVKAALTSICGLWPGAAVPARDLVSGFCINGFLDE